ncbi:MAG: AAA family ATPase [Ilumatobacter sp.]|nr:AAA family ATPase [Ilumatobacter sp.]
MTTHGGTVEVRVLGDTELRLAGEMVGLPRRQVRQVLNLLAVSAGQVVRSDVLLDELWPDGLPAHPRKALNVVLSRLRAALGPHAARLEQVGEGYRFSPDTVDADRFVALVDAARADSSDVAIESLSSALAMWTGPPFAECAGERSEQRRSSLDEHRWFAITRLVELVLEHGDASHAVALAAPYVREQPFRERLVTAYATALARDGRKTEALAAIAASSAHLRDELGLEPSSAMVQAERSILTGAVDLAMPQQQTRTSDDLFVGRAEEVEALCCVGPRRPIVVVGEPGIGKTRLLEQVVTRVRSGDGRVTGVAVPASPERPLETIALMCVQLATDRPDLVDAYSSTLGRLCPELGLGATTVSLTREAMLDNAVSFIESAADGSVIVLDDCQWMDRGSASVVRELVDRGATRLILAMRPTGDETVGSLTGEDGAAHVIELVPLSVDDVAALADTMWPGRGDAQLARDIATRAAGNALFVRLLLDHWAQGTSTSPELPTDVLVAVAERLDVLARRTVESLQVASVIGSTFALHTLRQLRPTADGDLDAAHQAGLIRLEPHADRAHFVHQLVAEACRSLVPSGRLVTLHDGIGRILAADEASVGEQARHFVACAILDPHRAVQASLDAAAEFAVGFDWHNAARHLTDAVDLVAEHSIEDRSMLAELTVRRGIVGRALQDAAYVDTLIAGTKLAAEVGDDELTAIAVTELCGHGLSTDAGAVDEQIATLLEAALCLDLAPDHRAELCASGSVVFSHTNDAERGRRLYHEALGIASSLGDVEIEAAVLERAHLGLAHPDDFDLRRTAAWRLGEIAGSDVSMRWESAFLRFQTSAVVGDPAAVRDAIIEMRELTPLVRRRNRDFGMSFSEAAFAQLTGDLDLAEHHANETLKVGLARYPEGWAVNLYSMILLGIRNSEGRLGELDGVVDKQLATSPDFLPYRIVAAAAASAAGNTERAQHEAGIVWTAGFDAVPHDGFWTAFAVLFAEPTAAHGTPSQIAWLHDELSRFAGRMSWNGASTCGPVDRALAELAEASGDTVRASTLRRSAAELEGRFVDGGT